MGLIALKTDPTRRELRMFALLWVPLFGGLFALLLWYRSGRWVAPAVIAGAAAAIALLGLVRPAGVRPIFLGLIYLTAPIGWVVSHAVLALVYYCVVTPIGLALRALGRDPLQRRFDPRRDSYFEPITRRRRPADYLRQF
jgi:hypothetical protein